MADIRIIGGQWRGRKIAIAKNSQLRPTPSRVRETLFNWLIADIHGARCLDMFAGTGVLGLEALSRGAQYVEFWEAHKATAANIKQNLVNINIAEQTKLKQNDALKMLQQPPERSFDIIFIDPPFRQGFAEKVIALIEQYGWLSDTGCIYLEVEKELDLGFMPSTWQLHRHKQAGDVQYALYFK